MSTQWFCRILQEEFGPMVFEELQELALSGTLGRGDLVRRETDDAWTAASKCLELRETFRKLEPTDQSPPTRHEKKRSARIEPSLAVRPSRQDSVFEEATPSEAIASCDHCHPRTTPRQRWIAWSVTVGLMLALFLADRLIASAAPTFPPPRQVREQLAEFSWFLGTGPWSLWECLLLWLDTFIVLGVVSLHLSKRLAR